METITTITPRFQVHIPVSIRKKIGLKSHGRAKVRVENSKIVIEPIKSTFLTLAGSYKVAKPVAAETIRSRVQYSEKS